MKNLKWEDFVNLTSNFFGRVRMHDFQKIKQICERNSDLTREFVDEFLLYFVSGREGLDDKLRRQIAMYKHIVAKMNKSWANYLMSQLIAHRLFKKDGLAIKYVSNPTIQSRSGNEIRFLEFQIKNPWRFSFCRIIGKPSADFYEMQDVLSQETFLLYSQGVGSIIKESGMEPALWFMLIGFNGECYQTYSTIEYFKGFQPFDIFFFAKKLKADLLFSTDVPALIDLNPIPFLMLWIGGEIPVTYNKEHLMVCCQSEYRLKEFNTAIYEKDFNIEERQKVVRLGLKDSDVFPHFSTAYFDRKKNLLMLSSMTKHGYDILVTVLNKHDNDYPKEPDILSTLGMIHTVKNVLRIDVAVNPYEKRFINKTPAKDKEVINTMNVFLRKLIDKLNNKEPYNLEVLANESGVDIENAKQMEVQLKQTIKNMPNNML
jgi:hypothetical protein